MVKARKMDPYVERTTGANRLMGAPRDVATAQ